MANFISIQLDSFSSVKTPSTNKIILFKIFCGHMYNYILVALAINNLPDNSGQSIFHEVWSIICYLCNHNSNNDNCLINFWLFLNILIFDRLLSIRQQATQTKYTLFCSTSWLCSWFEHFISDIWLLRQKIYQLRRLRQKIHQNHQHPKQRITWKLMKIPLWQKTQVPAWTLMEMAQWTTSLKWKRTTAMRYLYSKPKNSNLNFV